MRHCTIRRTSDYSAMRTGVIGKTVVGTGGIGGGLVGGVAVPCATGGDALINTGGVVGSGIGGGVGVITTGPAPCGGIVVGDVTKRQCHAETSMNAALYHQADK